MSLVLDAAQLSRVFGKGENTFTAVDRVSLRVSSGEIHALLGPNGAGKTTTVQMCSTLLTPTGGNLTVNGIDAIAHPQRARRHVGLALGGENGFYPRASARDNLLFFADVAGVSGRTRRHEVEHALARVELTDAGKTLPKLKIPPVLRTKMKLIPLSPIWESKYSFAQGSPIPVKFQTVDADGDGYLSFDEIIRTVDDFFTGNNSYTPDDIYELNAYFFAQ